MNSNKPRRVIAIEILLTVSVTDQSGWSARQLYDTGQSVDANTRKHLILEKYNEQF